MKSRLYLLFLFPQHIQATTISLPHCSTADDVLISMAVALHETDRKKTVLRIDYMIDVDVSL